jgi:cytochrome c5
LYTHGLNGFKMMPAKGGNPGLKDDEVKAAIDFMAKS